MRLFIIAIIIWLITVPAQAHPGNTNADGCHAGKQSYHCHSSDLNHRPSTSTGSAWWGTTAEWEQYIQQGAQFQWEICVEMRWSQVLHEPWRFEGRWTPTRANVEQDCHQERIQHLKVFGLE